MSVDPLEQSFLDRGRLRVAERVVSGILRRLLAVGLKTRPVRRDQLTAPRPGRRYALYLHVPFCETLCPYCSFHRVPFRSLVADRYFDDLEAEMRLAAALGYRCDTLYVGGGTPTVDVDRLLGVMRLARELFGVKEISCETHAHHLRPEIAGRLSGSVQRLSVGVQTLDEEILRRMRRDPEQFSAADTLAAIREMNPLFPTLNVDLIFNLPGQSEDGLRGDLDRVLATGVRQVTTYPLMSSPGVARDMEHQLGGRSASREYEMFRIIEERMRSESMRASSPWCYSRPRETMIDEYIVDAPEYVGLGSGAFSLLDGAWYVNSFSLNRYSERVRAGKMGLERTRRFRSWELRHYQLLMGLFGLDLNRVEGLRDAGPLRSLELFLLRCVDGFEPGRAVLSHNGRYLALAMMREFFAGMNTVRDQLRAELPAAERGHLSSYGGEEHRCPAYQPVAGNDSLNRQ